MSQQIKESIFPVKFSPCQFGLKITTGVSIRENLAKSQTSLERRQHALIVECMVGDRTPCMTCMSPLKELVYFLVQIDTANGILNVILREVCVKMEMFQLWKEVPHNSVSRKTSIILFLNSRRPDEALYIVSCFLQIK